MVSEPRKAIHQKNFSNQIRTFKCLVNSTPVRSAHTIHMHPTHVPTVCTVNVYSVLSWPDHVSSSCREFAKEKDRVESRAVFLRIKEEQKLEREMNGYMNWICRAGKGHIWTTRLNNMISNTWQFDHFSKMGQHSSRQNPHATNSPTLPPPWNPPPDFVVRVPNTLVKVIKTVMCLIPHGFVT